MQGGLAAAQAWLRLLRLRGSLVAELPAMEGREYSNVQRCRDDSTHERNRGGEQKAKGSRSS